MFVFRDRKSQLLGCIWDQCLTYTSPHHMLIKVSHGIKARWRVQSRSLNRRICIPIMSNANIQLKQLCDGSSKAIMDSDVDVIDDTPPSWVLFKKLAVMSKPYSWS